MQHDDVSYRLISFKINYLCQSVNDTCIWSLHPYCVVGVLVKPARPSGSSVVELLSSLVDLRACLLRNLEFKVQMARQIKMSLDFRVSEK